MLFDWPYLEQYKTDLYHFCEETLKGLDELRKELKKEDSKGEVEKREPLKIRIKPQVPSPAEPVKAQREELHGVDSSVEERPKKRHCGDSGMAV